MLLQVSLCNSQNCTVSKGVWGYCGQRTSGERAIIQRGPGHTCGLGHHFNASWVRSDLYLEPSTCDQMVIPGVNGAFILELADVSGDKPVTELPGNYIYAEPSEQIA